MKRNQDQIFAASEGDRWFARNKDFFAQFDPNTDIPLRMIDLYQLGARSVLEIGAANGFRLAAIAERLSARVVAVELSADAIKAGKRNFPQVEFVQAMASAIPLRELFDLVIVNFVFHWIGRENLLRSVAEVDRLLEDGGFLIIGDFFLSNLTKVSYHHLPRQEVYTFKQNYAATFLASGLYHTVCLLTGDHSTKAFRAEVSEHDRMGVWLLRKMLQEHYVKPPTRE